MSMVGGQDDHRPGVPGPIEQWPQVLDGVGLPGGAARVGPVERVVDRVQHAGDQGLLLTSAIAAATSSAIACTWPGGVERPLVEQRRACQTVRTGERLEPGPLGVLSADRS